MTEVLARVDGVPCATIPVTDRGLIHGDSVFEVARVRRGRVPLLAWHRERLEAGLNAFRFGDASALWGEVDALLADVGERDGVLRILVTRGEGSVRAPLASFLPRRIVVFRDAPPAPSAPLRLALVESPRVTPELPSHVAKYARYLPYLLANDDARARGFDEALLLDGTGNVAEAATANVFAALGGLLVTPPRACGILPGVTRRWILENAQALGVSCTERNLSRPELAAANEVFLASSVRGLVPVGAVDGATFSRETPLRDRLARAYEAL
jgi:branched-chain amino acid aminotransferase